MVVMVVEGEGAILVVNLGHPFVINGDSAATRSSQIILGGPVIIILHKYNTILKLLYSVYSSYKNCLLAYYRVQFIVSYCAESTKYVEQRSSSLCP